MPNVIASIASSGPRQLWSVVAGLCLLVALLLWAFERTDAAFVLSALGLISWFLNVRRKLESEYPAIDRTPDEDEEVLEDEDEK